MSNLLKNLFFILGLTVLLFLGYMVFLRNADVSQTGNFSTVTAEEETDALLQKIKRLESYNTGAPIFNGTNFESLTSFRVELLQEPTGRPNPFAPVE